VLADVLYAIGVAVVIGAGMGYGLAALAVRLRDRELLASELDGWLAVAAVPLIYGASEVAGTYGFLAVFCGGLAFRRYERTHEYNRGVHAGAELVEKFAELTVILLIGTLVTFNGLQAPGIAGWALVALLLVVIRPLAVAIAFTGLPVPASERRFVGWFGVRGIGSLYYASFVLAADALSRHEAGVIFWTAVACVIVSIAVHGVTAAPLGRRWLRPEREVEPASLWRSSG
jgi:NhaP-type Na+/H+ or K+/H+ antiporter